MSSTLHIFTSVLPGNRVEVSSPELREGETVEVILVRSDKSQKQSALQIIEALNGHRLFRDAGEVSRHLDEERNSWDR